MEKDIIKFYRELDDATLQAFWEQGGVIDGKEYPLADTFLHTHTDLGSPKDSVLTVDAYLKVASEMGASSLSVTDHGDMYGVIPMYKACDAYNAGKPEEEQIKCIIGIEFYVCEFDSTIKKKQTRLHLIAYAKDTIGYHVLCRLTTEGNKHIIKAGDNAYPCVSKADLERYLAAGAEGHGHVILTSACIGGVIAGIMYESNNETKNAQRFAQEIQTLQNLDTSYKQQMARIDQLTQQKDQMQALTKKTYTKRLNILKKQPDDAAMAQLQQEMQETEMAKKELPKLRNMLNAAKTGATTIKTEIKKYCAKTEGDTLEAQMYNRLSQLQQAYAESCSNIIPEDQVEAVFTQEMLYYQNLAGKENWFIELQFHGIDQEKKYMHVLADLAMRLDMPVVAANDAHMATKDQIVARKIVNALRFKATWEPPVEDEYELYLKTDAQLYQWLCKEVPKNIAFQAMKNRKLITDNCNVVLKKENHYPVYVA